MATTLLEITDLFSKLACHLQTLNHTSQNEEEQSNSINISLSKLNQSLNLTDSTDVRVLDTALSLMCFNAPQVFDSVIEYTVNTIVTFLSSSISCTFSRLGKQEVLRIGSSISQGSCVEFIEAANDIVSKLDEYGIPSRSLLYAAARVAVSTSCCRVLVPPMHGLDAKSDRTKIVSKFLCRLRGEFSVDSGDMPLRLMSWYLDPLTLKRDISNVLQDIVERPFLCLSKEFYERMEWRSILMCLMLSPLMFTQTRALLHNWFMLTGLWSILELLIELVSLLLDVISRPTWWGISMKLGSRLPFSNAYFPYKHHLLRLLAGPISSLSFLQLVNETSELVSLVREQISLTSKASIVKTASIDPTSIWAMAICFPDWYYFASVLLFSDKCFQKNFQLTCIVDASKFGHTNHTEKPPPAAAARYIAWILSPKNKSHQHLLFDSLIKASECWILKRNDSGIYERGKVDYTKKLKKPLSTDMEEDFSLENKYDCQVIGLWLREFQSIMKFGDYESINNSSSYVARSNISVLRNSLLFRRIPLGILICFPSYVKEDGFELLLHYAATGRIQDIIDKNGRTEHLELNSGGLEEFVVGNDECAKKEAVAGACLVFSLTDIVERMSASLFENEKSGLDIICLVKLKASRYLIKCINRLIQPNIVEDGKVMLVDLHGRLERWRNQGQEMLKLDKDLDNAFRDLSDKLLSL